MESFAKLIVEMFKTASPLRKYELILSAGFAAAAVIAFYIIGKDKLILFLQHFEQHPEQQSLSFILFIITTILGILWIISVLLEILWIDRYYENLMPSPPNGAIFVAMFVGGFLLVLAYTSDNIQIYSFCFVIYALFTLLSDAIQSNTAEKAINSYEKNGGISEDLIKEIRLFYLQRPKKLIGFFRIFVTIAAIGVSIFGKMDNVAYLLMIAMLIINETFYWSWRIRLYRRHGFVFV